MSALVIEPLPESLLAKLARSAQRHHRTVPQEALALLLEATADESDTDAESSYFARRKLLPEFEQRCQTGAFAPKPGDRDITDVISEERDGR